MNATHLTCLAALLFGLVSRLSAGPLEAKELATLGHRNFVVVADMAYPWQSGAGIQTRYVGGEHLKLVKELIEQVDAAPHVNPVIYVDAELSAIGEEAAPGITAYRKSLEQLLDGRNVKRLPHMEIIKKLDASAKLFEVRIFKTDLTLPYTSVFIELDCGYWDAEREQAMRKKPSTDGR